MRRQEDQGLPGGCWAAWAPGPLFAAGVLAPEGFLSWLGSGLQAGRWVSYQVSPAGLWVFEEPAWEGAGGEWEGGEKCFTLSLTPQFSEHNQGQEGQMPILLPGGGHWGGHGSFH